MDILLTGAFGTLGTEIRKHIKCDAYVGDIIKANIKKPYDVVIHCAALTGAEECEINKTKAYNTNVIATKKLLDASVKANPDVHFIYISTSGVFDCEKGGYYEYDTPNPVNYYCFTKLCGELVIQHSPNVLIIRTSFVSKKFEYETAYTNRYGTYLKTEQVAKELKEIIKKRTKGVIHLVGKKSSIYDFVRKDNKVKGKAYVDVRLPMNMCLKSRK